MAKTIGPLFSLRASASIGDTLTYASWKGIPYVRTLVIPSNPNSTAQQEVRNVWSTLNELYKRLGSIALAPWDASVVGQPLTARNRFLQINQSAMYDETDMSDFAGSPGTGGAPPATSVTPSDAGAQVLNLAFVNPTPPTGWTLISVQGVAFLQGDPQTGLVPLPIEDEDSTPPLDNVQILVGSAGTYVWSAWPQWTKPDGSFAYGPSISGTQVIA